MDWWKRWPSGVVLTSQANTNAQPALDYPQLLGCTSQVNSLIFCFFFFVFFLTIDFDIDVDNGFELSPNPDDHPVAGEAFSLLCGVSVYNYTTDLAWFWTSPNNVTKQIVARRPPQGFNIQYSNNEWNFRVNKANNTNCSKVIVWFNAGISIFYPNMTYSYAESLNWSKIPRSAGGKYTCQSTSLDGITSNKTVSFVVRGIKLLL